MWIKAFEHTEHQIETSFAAIQSFKDANFIFVDDMDKRLREVRLQRVPTAAKLGAIADEIEDSTPVKRIKGIKHNFGDPQTPVVPPISADNAARVKTIYLIFPRIRRTATQSNKEAQLRQMSRYPISFERTRRKLWWDSKCGL